MNNKKYIINSVSYVTVVNIISMLITAFLTLILPKFMGVYDYGLWQLFVFYQSYLGFFHFGWNDGIYIRYGGKEYSDLNKSSFFTQFWLQILFEILISILLVKGINDNDLAKEYIIWQLAFNLIILNSRYMLIYLLQTTARIREYAYVLLVDRFFYILIIVISMSTKTANFKSIIWAESISKLLAYLLAIYFCNDIVFNKISKFKLSIQEITTNVSVGMKIMFSNIASILIIGIIRFGIENNWGVVTFGEISLTITLSQLFITFVTNIGMIIFPLLKKMDSGNLVKTYILLKDALTILIFGGFVFFYPAKLILLNWLPSYETSISFMGLLLPLCFYESKMALLNNTYLKALRKEKKIMVINVLVMLISVGFSALFSFAFHDLTLSVFSITILIAIRCVWSEKTVNDALEIKKRTLFDMDNTMMLIFIISSYIINGWQGFLIYFGFCIGYLIKKKETIKNFLNAGKRIIGK